MLTVCFVWLGTYGGTQCLGQAISRRNEALKEKYSEHFRKKQHNFFCPVLDIRYLSTAGPLPTSLKPLSRRIQAPDGVKVTLHVSSHHVESPASRQGKDWQPGVRNVTEVPFKFQTVTSELETCTATGIT